jgi:septum formation protein
MRLILASGSPRRAALLREHGYAFDVLVPLLDEPAEAAEALPPAQCAEALSYYKARSVAERVDEGIILGGDTVVAVGDSLYGKPTDRAHARRILQDLAGTTHHVITGVTLLDASTGARVIEHATTAVTMRQLSPGELEGYLDTGAWEGKAGAYGIQDRGDAFVTRVEGSFTNVVGLPMELVGRLLRQWDLRPPRA